MTDDFSNAKVGDKVLIVSGGWGRHMTIGEISAVGKIHVTVLGTKYRFSGRRAGSNSYYGGDSLVPFNQQEWDEYREGVRLNHIRRELADFRWRDCDKELALKVYELLPKKTEGESHV